MREIKFRAWIDGAYGFHILGESMLIGGLFQDYKIEDLNNIIIEQFTGLLDKNGKEGFGGDKVKFDSSINRPIYQIKWSICDAGFYLEGMNEQKERMAINNLLVGEVIGNIHENKDLLE